jgi:hypothetical protein
MKWYKNFVLVWGVFYLFLAFYGRVFLDSKEFFPFFRWSLYSKTPNYVEHPFIMVERIGDSLLQNPINIKYLSSYHKIKPVDMNMNVNQFYNQFLKLNPDTKIEHGLFKVLPENSLFTLYLKRFDLSEKDYRQTISIEKIAEFQNNTVKTDEGFN